MVATAGIPQSRFSTRPLAPDQKFSAWRDQLSIVFEPHLPTRADPMRFEAEVEGYLFGPISQMRCVAGQQHFSRDKRKTDADGFDNYMIQVFRRGNCLANAPDGELKMDVGDICIFDNAQPLDSYNSDFDLFALFVPRDILAPLIANPDGRHLTVVRADDPLATLLRNHLIAIFDGAGRFSADAAELLAKPTLELLAATLNGAPDATEGGDNAVRFAVATQIRRYIDDRLEDPDLSADSVAEQCGVSRARLYRLFAAYDGVANYIRNRRLATAMTILRDPRQQFRKIVDIAYSVGFGSEGSFIRAFRRRYGRTPAESRLHAGKPEVSRAVSPTAGDTSWRDWMCSFQP